MEHNKTYKDFYESQKVTILDKNIKMIKYLSVTTVVVLLIFLMLAIFFYDEEERRVLTTVFTFSAVLFTMVFCVCTFIIEKPVQNYKVRTIFIWFIMIAYMILVIYGNTFTIKNGRGVFFPLLLSILPSLLILRIRETLAYLVAATTLFIVLNLVYKEGDVRMVQIYIALGAFFISAPYNYAINKLRLRDLYNTYRYQVEAQIDVLTQLPNRRAFYEMSDELFKNQKFQSIAFFIIDIDALKTINDTSGHQAGDAMILKVAEVLRNYAIHNQYAVYRYGGDEFVACATNYNADRIMESLDELYQNIYTFNQNGGLKQDVELSLSIGVYYNDRVSKSREEMLSIADEALYMAKDKGKNQYVFLDDEALEESQL